MRDHDERSDSPAGGDRRSYRCPVCGHADDVTVPEGESVLIRCSHCQTALEVQQDPGTTERVSVQVASEEAGG